LIPLQRRWLPRLDLVMMWRRLRKNIRMLFARGDATTLFIACLMMVIPVLSLSQALSFTSESLSGSWEVSFDQLIPVAVLSVVFGFLLSRSYYSELVALILSTVYSVGTILAVQLVAAQGDLVTRVYNVASRFVRAAQNGFVTTSGLDPYLLILFLSILIWFLGHNTAWHIFRLDRVWRAILPSGVVLVLNSVYNVTPDVQVDSYLILYVFLALLLIVRSHIEAREYDWYMSRIAYRGSVRRWFFRFGAALAALMLLFAWAMPTGNAQENARRFQEFLNGDFMTQAIDFLNRLFGSVEGNQPISTDFYGGEELRLGGPIRLRDDVVMAVQAPPGRRYYWKSTVFDTYSNGTWTTRIGQTIGVGAGGVVLNLPPEFPNSRQQVEQRVFILSGTSRLIYAAPQARTLKFAANIRLQYLDQGLMDPLLIRPAEPLPLGSQYTVTSAVSTAGELLLRGASTDYPLWVREHYLQVPPEVTLRTRRLAQDIVNAAGAVTPYDRAKAIERWLRLNIAYAEVIPIPPEGVEPIDWVLFTNKQAYCTYYASSMIMMLRSLGIPARMAAGFSQGQYENGFYMIKERDAHTWVEVYFPGAGWVEFEPTQGRDVLERPQVSEVTPSPTPFIPTATPTPSPTPTPPPTNTLRPGELPPPPPLATFTPSPPPLPPTRTPAVPPPPSPLDFPPPVANFLNGLLLAVILVAGLSFVGVGLLWYLDYRGYDRLSLSGRAYARLSKYAEWLNIAFKPGSTPLERGRRIAREVPKEGQEVMTITDAYISERYAPPDKPPDDDEGQVNAAWRATRRAVWRKRLRGK